MIDESFEWAAARGLVRRNPVHKEEEAKLVLKESFSSRNEKGEEYRMMGDAEMEDWPTLFICILMKVLCQGFSTCLASLSACRILMGSFWIPTLTRRRNSGPSLVLLIQTTKRH